MFVSPTDLMTFKLGSNFYGGMTNFHYEKNKWCVNLGIHGNTYNRTHMGNIDTLFLYKNTGTKVDYSTYSKIGYNIGKFTLFTDIQVRKVGFSYVGDSTMSPLSWTFINPKCGITYNHTKNINYYLSVGQNHREPTRTDMFGGQDNLISLNIITPEQVIDYELGSNLKLSRLNLQYNVYYMDFKNEITFLGGLGPNGLNLMTNVSKSFRSGIELDLNYRLFKSLTLTNTSNYAYSRIQGNGKEYVPLYTPNFVSNTGIVYTYKNFNMGILAKYQSFSYINPDNTSTIPSYILYNATIGYAYKAYSIAAQLVNITNTRYYTSGYTMGGTDRYLYVNAPLSGYITLKATF